MPTKTLHVAIIVAHPDDEILWAGGTMMNNPTWDCYIISLCRAHDTDRAERFYKMLNVLEAKGMIADLDDGPTQDPLEISMVEKKIIELLPKIDFEIIITHNILGEYTKHLRHEEVSKAVLTLWEKDIIKAKELWFFAYEDGNKAYLPLAVREGTYYQLLSDSTWQRKYQLITETYGFRPDSWEAKTTPKAEAFYLLKKANETNI